MTGGRRWFALVLVGAVLAAGCASQTGRRDTASWLEARGADFMDVFGVRVAFGAGLGGLVRATRYAQFGFMYRGAPESELFGSGSATRSVPCFMFGTIGRYGGAWFDSHVEIAFPGYTTRDEVPSPIEREVIVGLVSSDGTADRWEYAFGAGVHLLLVGFDAELRPIELFDFFAGLLGYDPSSDDVPVASPIDS